MEQTNENEFMEYCRVYDGNYPISIVELGYFHLRVKNDTLEFLTNDSSDNLSSNLGRFWSGKLTKCKN